MTIPKTKLQYMLKVQTILDSETVQKLQIWFQPAKQYSSQNYTYLEI
jgi:hypothetical protein